MKSPTAALEEAVRRTAEGARRAQTCAAGWSETRTSFLLSECSNLFLLFCAKDERWFVSREHAMWMFLMFRRVLSENKKQNKNLKQVSKKHFFKMASEEYSPETVQKMVFIGSVIRNGAAIFSVCRGRYFLSRHLSCRCCTPSVFCVQTRLKRGDTTLS